MIPMGVEICDSACMKTQACIWLSPEDRATLEGWVADRNTPQKLVWRARIVLMSAAREGTAAIMRAVGKSKPSVWRWQERYLAQGIEGLARDATRPGRIAPLTPEVIGAVVEKTLREKPSAATQWSMRTMARAMGISHSSVQRIWQAHELKPHLTRGFKLSNDKRFVEKVQDVVGLYLNPPDKALVLSVDEKSQIQALDRTQPGLREQKFSVPSSATSTRSPPRRWNGASAPAAAALSSAFRYNPSKAEGAAPSSMRRI